MRSANELIYLSVEFVGVSFVNTPNTTTIAPDTTTRETFANIYTHRKFEKYISTQEVF